MMAAFFMKMQNVNACVKENIALDKIMGKEDFIQGYCNRGVRPGLSLSSTPLKRKVRGFLFLCFPFFTSLSPCPISSIILFHFFLALG